MGIISFSMIVVLFSVIFCSDGPADFTTTTWFGSMGYIAAEVAGGFGIT